MFSFLRDNWREVLQSANEHLALVFIAMILAVCIGVPLGIVAARVPRLQRAIIGGANILQTVPSLAMFGFLLAVPFVGLGPRNAIIALVLYSLLPLVRTTLAGIAGVDRGVRESAVAMGMTDAQILRQVELPLAASVILSGVRVATVLCVGVATIASLISAGGLGTYIQNGLRTLDNGVTLAGAIPAALMALGADGALGALQNHLERRSSGREATNGRARVLARLQLAPLVLILLLGAAGAVSGARSLFGARESGTTASATTQSGAAENSERVFRIGSKEFSESRLLAEVLAQTIRAEGGAAKVSEGLGGSLPHRALLDGQIDAYPEYTGTAFMEILKRPAQTDARRVYDEVKREYSQQFKVEVSSSLGYSNGFAILVRGEDARRLNLENISDLARVAPRWNVGCGPDFISRPDGYRGFVKTYGLRFARAPRSMDLSLIHRALAAKSVDVVVGSETDGLISKLDLVQLRDDKNYFPPYETVLMTRRDALKNSLVAQRAINRLAGKIAPDDIRRMNLQVDAERAPIKEVAREFLQRKLGIAPQREVQ